MPASSGSRLPLVRLHWAQAVTTFCQVVRPPLERGMMWSKVRSLVGCGVRQYWHMKRSRRKTLNRVNAGERSMGAYFLSEITLGSRSSQRGEWTTRSYSCTTFTRPRNTALMASCQDHTDNGK